jgi:(R,R)-butanediol dehydrogenase/meso-butanediol dehydrogenase/diacetyl reductase
MAEVRLQFAMMYSKHDFGATIAALADRGAAAARLVTGTVSLDELPATFDSLRGPSHHCKVMVAPWGAAGS